MKVGVNIKMSRLRCKKCNSTNIELIGADKNIKRKNKETSLNLNPLKPLTILNHKTKVKKKNSIGKIGLGFITGGVSLLFTGVKNNKTNEYFCLNCGNRWFDK